VLAGAAAAAAAQQQHGQLGLQQHRNQHIAQDKLYVWLRERRRNKRAFVPAGAAAAAAERQQHSQLGLQQFDKQ
jgi:IS5 family transposase